MAGNGENTWWEFFTSMQTFLELCETKYPSCSSEETCDILDKIKTYLRTLRTLEEILTVGVVVDGTHERILVLTHSFERLKHLWVEKAQQMNCCSNPAQIVEVSREQSGLNLTEGKPGRPKTYIDTEQISFLHNIGFSQTTIARMLMIDRSTLHRRIFDSGVDVQRFTTISDEDLLTTVRSIYHEHPHCGAVMMRGHLRARGIHVQRQRVRNALREIDPASSALRWGLMVTRRSYSVPGPNSLWHIDGHHALIRWRFVTHGGIDGYSRLIVYLHCSNNNRAETVESLFQQAVIAHGCPSRVRADFGGENVLVRTFMENARGYHRGSFLAGRSVHNSRIERLWRDLYYAVIQTYYSLFYFMESAGTLDINNELDLYALHYVYLPRINQSVSEFRNAYNNHSLRSEKNWTPMQIWTNGMVHQGNRDLIAVRDVLDAHSVNAYGIDPARPFEEVDVGSQDIEISIPDSAVILPEEVLQLITSVDPLKNSEDYGQSIYLEVQEIIRNSSDHLEAR